MASKGQWGRDPSNGRFYSLIVSVSVSWLWYCAMGLQDVTIGGNWVKGTWTLCIVSYNCMWTYSYLKIKSLITKMFMKNRCLRLKENATIWSRNGFNVFWWMLHCEWGWMVVIEYFVSRVGQNGVCNNWLFDIRLVLKL